MRGFLNMNIILTYVNDFITFTLYQREQNRVRQKTDTCLRMIAIEIWYRQRTGITGMFASRLAKLYVSINKILQVFTQNLN